MAKIRTKNLPKIIIVALLILILFFTLFALFDFQLDLEASPVECTDEEIIEVEVVEERFGYAQQYNNLRPNPIKLPFKSQPLVFHRQDNFSDLVEYLAIPRSFDPAPFEYVIIREASDEFNPTLADMWGQELSPNATNLEKFQWSISKKQTYRENDSVIPALLHDIATLPIIGAEEKKGGTEIKLTIEFPKNIYALFKPMRFPRDHETDENHYHFQDYERHHSEIAAHHLDRALKFYRTIPVVGRKIHILKDLENVVEESFFKTFFTSPSNNTCFHGTCRQYCDIFHPVCGNPDMLEGSFAAYIPTFDAGGRTSIKNPWKRSYLLRKKAPWENQPKFCAKVVEDPAFNKGRRLLDIMDIAVFDFLMGNADRHSFNIFTIFGNETSPVLYDNGRGFGRAHYDDFLVLAPLTQCCIIRESTFKTLLNFQNGPLPLSAVMRKSLANDPLAPILWEHHLIALDRRVELILKEIRKCIARKESESFSS